MTASRRDIALGLIAAAIREPRALKWAVITVDDETAQPNVLCVIGPFDSDRDAAEHAGSRTATTTAGARAAGRT